jgi:hypothetical protein
MDFSHPAFFDQIMPKRSTNLVWLKPSPETKTAGPIPGPAASPIVKTRTYCKEQLPGLVWVAGFSHTGPAAGAWYPGIPGTPEA